MCVHARCTDAHAVSSNAVIEHGLQHHGFVLIRSEPYHDACRHQSCFFRQGESKLRVKEGLVKLRV
jgi:hypothetical protein